MRASALAVLALLAAGSVQAAPPYPSSTLITGITWDKATHQFSGVGGDRWPVTSSADGRVYTAWGDGKVGCSGKVSNGNAAIAGGPSAKLTILRCGRLGLQGGKFHALLAVEGTHYGIVRMQKFTKPKSGFAIWRSTDKGKTWLAPNPSWVFPRSATALHPDGFVNFGPDYAGARDEYVYLPAVKEETQPKSVYLLRVLKTRLQDQAGYEYFAGTAAAPSWSQSASAAKPVFIDQNGVEVPKMVYNAGLRRYLLTVAHGNRSRQNSGGRLGVFEAPEPWGAWRTVDYQESWLGITGGHSLGLDFPTLWMADAGRSLWAVFSCMSRGNNACGPYNDRYNLIKATLKVAAP